MNWGEILMDRYPPGPKAWLWGLNLAIRFRKTPLEFMTELGSYGDIAFLRLGPYRVYFVNHPDLIREVLITKAKIFQRHERHKQVFRPVDGNSLINSEGDFWLRQRRLVQPAFHTRRMAHHAQATVELTRRMLRGWPPAGIVNVAEEMALLSLALIARAVLDAELSAELRELSQAFFALSPILLREMWMAPFSLPDWLPLPSKWRKRRALQIVNDIVWKHIRERRASSENRGDMLSMLLAAVDEEGDSQGMTDAQARDETITLFNAGHENTAAGLAWVWYLVSSHPEVEAELVREVDEVLGGLPATVEDLTRLRYTESVIKESMRLYPPAWVLFTREALAEVELGGYRIPTGSNVILSPYVTHRDARFFENPEQFDPGRFAPGRAERIPPYAYFPFGAGPHVCIGNGFAMMEMTLIVATVLQQCRLAPTPGQEAVEPELVLALRPKGGLRVTVNRRQVRTAVETS
jgi:cytochrome P450